MTLQTKRIKLTDAQADDKPKGPNYAAALDKLHRLLRAESTLGSDGLPLWAVEEKYREYLERSKPHLVRPLKKWTSSFFAMHGDLQVRDLKPYHVHDWLAGQATWGPTSRQNAIKRLLACLNWSARSGIVYANPVKGKVEIPEANVRGEEVRLPVELIELMIRSIKDDGFRLYTRVLWETAARPIELCMADVRHYRAGRIIHRWNAPPGEYRWKCARTRKDRIIHLTDETAAELERTIAGRADGPIFMNRRGKRFRDVYVRQLWIGLRRHPEVAAYLAEHQIDPRNASMYAFRHTRISLMIEAGMLLMEVAGLCGTSVRLLERVYGHLDTERLGQRYREMMRGQPI